LSDLANSCEYLTIDMLCSTVSESEKAKANRQSRCQNEEKLACCYICQSRPQCEVRCRYLGNVENSYSRIESKSVESLEKIKNGKALDEDPLKNSPVTCVVCNMTMSKTNTNLKINRWDGTPPKLDGGVSGKLGQELPLIVYLCPQCGKIEFRAKMSQ
jgi:hypothetical protein